MKAWAQARSRGACGASCVEASAVFALGTCCTSEPPWLCGPMGVEEVAGALLLLLLLLLLGMPFEDVGGYAGLLLAGVGVRCGGRSAAGGVVVEGWGMRVRPCAMLARACGEQLLWQ